MSRDMNPDTFNDVMLPSNIAASEKAYYLHFLAYLLSFTQILVLKTCRKSNNVIKIASYLDLNA